jgi:hypothetical protein
VVGFPGHRLGFIRTPWNGIGRLRQATQRQDARQAVHPAATQGAQQGILDRAAGGAPGIDQAMQTVAGMQGPDNIYRNLDAVRSQALGSAIPAAGALFSGGGLLNSSTAMDYAGRAATEAIAPIEYGAWNAAQDRSLQAAGMAPGLAEAAYLPQQMQARVGTQQDLMAQAMAEAEMAKYYEGQGQQANNFQGYLDAIMGLGQMGGTQSQTSPQPGTGIGPAIAGGLGTFGSLLGAGASTGLAAGGAGLSALLALSDRRAKEDIVKIGKTDGGSNLYRYKYKGQDGMHIGVMADENPHAIAGQVNGLNVVDYGRVM